LIGPIAIPMPKIIYQPGGCSECRNSGYAGRQGMRPLRLAGATKVTEGMTL